MSIAAFACVSWLVEWIMRTPVSPADVLAALRGLEGLPGLGLGWVDGCAVQGYRLTPEGRELAERLTP